MYKGATPPPPQGGSPHPEGRVTRTASPLRRIYYGWFILAACFAIMFLAVATRNSFGIFFKPILEDFKLSRAALSLPVALTLILFGVSQPIGGLLIRRFGARTVILWGSVLTSVGFLGTSWASSLWGIYLYYGILLGLGGIGNGFTAMTPLISSWFHERRGLAMSIVSTGSSLGQLALLPTFAIMLSYVSWRATLFSLGVFLLLVMVSLALFVIRDEPGETGPAAASARASAGQFKIVAPYDLPWVECLHKAPFLLLLTSFFTCGFTVTVIAVHWIPFATDVGFSPAVAATAFAVGGGLNTVGTLIVGPLSDKWGRKVPLSLVYAFRGLGFVLFIFFKNEYTVWAVPMMIGFSWIATVPLTSALTGDFFGPRNVAVLFGLITVSHQLGSGLSAWLSGYIYDLTGSYDIAFALAAYLCLQAALIVAFIKESEVRSARALAQAQPA